MDNEEKKEKVEQDVEALIEEQSEEDIRREKRARMKWIVFFSALVLIAIGLFVAIKILQKI
ncbi:MAG: hypothetical protein K5694_03385 [Bacilli bacterium]|nr:hypothetical protein [Bacilli bacterium]